MTLSEISTILGCSRAAASQLRSGTYPSPESELAKRYEALRRVVMEGREPDVKTAAEVLCRHCDREDCTGCRCLEV